MLVSEWQRLLIVAAIMAGSSLLWLLWQRSASRWNSTHAEPGKTVQGHHFPFSLGGHATIVQFSTEVCSTCHRAAAILEPLAADLPGVHYVHLDSAEYLDLVQEFKVMRAPTIILLDSRGHEVGRTSGVPDPEKILEQIDKLGPSAPYTI